MNLLSGLEKFGLKAEDTTNLFEEEKKVTVAADGTKTSNENKKIKVALI